MFKFGDYKDNESEKEIFLSLSLFAEKMRLFRDAAVSFWSSNMLSRTVYFSSLSPANLLQLISLNIINPLRFSITRALAEKSCPLKTFYVSAKVFSNTNLAGTKSAFSCKNNSVRAARASHARISIAHFTYIDAGM